MSKAKHEHHRLEEFKTAIESLSLEAIPAFARIGQETGLGASLPEDTPESETVKKSRTPRKVTKTARKKSAATKTGRVYK